MAYKPQDSRQVEYRQILQQLAPYLSGEDLSSLLQSIDSGLTPPLRADATNPASLVVNVGPIVVPNAISSRNNSAPFINNALPVFAGGTVTFPASSGGNITTSTGGSFALTLPSNEYAQVVLMLDSTGLIQVTIGVPNAVLANAAVPAPIEGTLPFAYVTLHNSAGTIQNISQSNIFQFLGGGGPSGAGGLINYIDNNNAESSTNGWSLYQNTAANIPLNGTGGSPTGLTFARSTVSPLRGMASFLLTQANSTNVQGEGVSYDFTIDPADQAKIIAITFDYNASNTFISSDGVTAPINDGTTSVSAGNSDVEVFAYDVTNSVLLPVTPEVIVGKGTNNFSFAGVFQTSSNSLNYRLIFHVATPHANATGWQFKFDNVFVGPQVFGLGANSENPTQTIFTSGSGTYTPPSGCAYIRVRMIGGGGGGGSNVASGTAGGDTTFGTSLLIAGGGSGGIAESSSSGGTAIINSPAIGVAINGGDGAPGWGHDGASTFGFVGGQGGSGAFGGAGSGGRTGTSDGSVAQPNSGAGGGGCGATPGNATGGGGGSGGFIDAIIRALSPSYSYSVGTAGTGASGANNGGNGAAGIIIIDEFYLSGGLQSEQSGKAPTVQVFTTGSGTYNLPNGPAPLYIEVEMVGGGGGGGGWGSGGGSGGNTTFGSSLLSCTGGGGGAQTNGSGSGGTGGSYSIGSGAYGWGFTGQSGSTGSDQTASTGGFGGSSPFGGNGFSAPNAGGQSAVPNTGSGGGGGGNTFSDSGETAGGGGSGGYLKAVIVNPQASYSFSVGSSGTAGASSGPKYGGGAGAEGIIIVREYYATGAGATPFSALANSPSVHPVGAIMSAYLTETQFQSQMGVGWVLQDGRNVTGSAYHILTGNTTIPDARGLFIRGAGTNAVQTLQNGGFPSGAAVGGYQQDEFASHTHAMASADVSTVPRTLQIANGIMGAGNSFNGYVDPLGGSSEHPNQPTGGAETRPVSVSANHFIKIN